MKYTYVAVMTNLKYYPGLCALAYSLQKVNSKYPLTVLLPDDIDSYTEEKVNQVPGVNVHKAARVDISHYINSDNSYSRWNDSFFKLQIFNLFGYDKLVFLDLDMIVLQNIDHLFTKNHMSSVAAGICVFPEWKGLNSGLMVVEPQKGLFEELITLIPSVCEYRISKNLSFGDQNVINTYYRDWYSHKELVLDETYNALSSYIEEVAKHYDYKDIKVFHFAEGVKPWQFSNFSFYKSILGNLIAGKTKRANLMLIYRKYVKTSCPDFFSYN